MRRAVALSCLLVACGSVHPRAAGPAFEGGPHSSRQPVPAVGTAVPRADGPTPRAEPAKPDDFFGASYPPSLEPAPHGRVGSLVWGTWIQPGPRSGSLPLGNIRPGDSLPLLSPETLAGNGGCPGFVRVEGGFVCVGKRATRNADSPWLKAGAWLTPAPGVMPYNFALSVGAPMLTRPLPKEKMVWKTGRRDLPRMKGWNAGHDELAVDEPIEPNGPLPDILEDGAKLPTPWGEPDGSFIKMLPVGSMIAYTRAFEAFGETWVLSTDMAVVPARGLKRFRVSEFQGVELGKGVELPLAWMRAKARPKWARTNGRFESTGAFWPVKTWVGLTGDEVKDGKRRFLETREPGLFIERSDATLVEKREKPPWETQGTGKWIHVRVNRGTLTLYEGPRPIFSTLMSPGKDGATPYGRYFMESEHHFSTMTTEEGEPTRFWIADVPWTMYFKRPYAIHTAYWHEDFGQRKSGGCVNLSPRDAKRVFDWTDPTLPPRWQSVQATGVGGTFVLVEG